jgi:hypothetical protein
VAVDLDRPAIGRGIATYVAITASCGLVLAFVVGSQTSGHESGLWVLGALIIIVAAPLAAGAVAGAGQRSPHIHGALAVALPFSAFLIVRAGIGVVQGKVTATAVVTSILFLVIFTALGMLGGYLGFRRRQRLA